MLESGMLDLQIPKVVWVSVSDPQYRVVSKNYTDEQKDRLHGHDGN